MRQWYAIQTRTQHEDKVRRELLQILQNNGLERWVDEAVIPMEKVATDLPSGERTWQEKRLMPGYVLLRMELAPLHNTIISAPGVRGFLGGDNPQAMPDVEVDQILGRKGTVKPSRQNGPLYKIGAQVKINDGPLADFSGDITEVDSGKGSLIISVQIFGRATPVQMKFSQVSLV